MTDPEARAVVIEKVMREARGFAADAFPEMEDDKREQVACAFVRFASTVIDNYLVALFDGPDVKGRAS